jgi:hypothetical protein
MGLLEIVFPFNGRFHFINFSTAVGTIDDDMIFNGGKNGRQIQMHHLAPRRPQNHIDIVRMFNMMMMMMMMMMIIVLFQLGIIGIDTNI